MIVSAAWIVLAALPIAAFGADFAFEIPPVPVSLNIAGQPVALTISGNISQSSVSSFDLNLHADMADLQNHLTPLMQAELYQSNRCGERISIQNATLVPSAPAGLLSVKLHFEKWVCIKAFGKENAKRLLEGDGTVDVILTPVWRKAAQCVSTPRFAISTQTALSVKCCRPDPWGPRYATESANHC